GEEPEDVARGVAHQRQRAGAELGGDQLAGAAGYHGLARLRTEELAEQVPGVQVHALVRTTLAGERPDLRLAAVIQELDAEGVLEIAAQRRRQRLGAREADAVREVAARIEPQLAGRVAEIGEEARCTGVDGRAPGARQLDLEPAVAGAAVQHEA